MKTPIVFGKDRLIFRGWNGPTTLFLSVFLVDPEAAIMAQKSRIFTWRKGLGQRISMPVLIKNGHYLAGQKDPDFGMKKLQNMYCISYIFTPEGYRP